LKRCHLSFENCSGDDIRSIVEIAREMTNRTNDTARSLAFRLCSAGAPSNAVGRTSGILANQPRMFANRQASAADRADIDSA
jgi:hypothetical protein